jgi:uncharacterized protein (TIGR00725 family)
MEDKNPEKKGASADHVVRLGRGRDRPLRHRRLRQGDRARQANCASGRTIVTGATTGFPMWSAMGAKQAGGLSIGFSPANNEKEHINTFKLPIEYMDVIVYTGFGFPGRDLIFTRSADAVLFGCGRIGTIHEFTIAFEDKKPIGIYEADWETDEVHQKHLRNGHRPNEKILFDTAQGARRAHHSEL